VNETPAAVIDGGGRSPTEARGTAAAAAAAAAAAGGGSAATTIITEVVTELLSLQFCCFVLFTFTNKISKFLGQKDTPKTLHRACLTERITVHSGLFCSFSLIYY